MSHFSVRLLFFFLRKVSTVFCSGFLLINLQNYSICCNVLTAEVLSNYKRLVSGGPMLVATFLCKITIPSPGNHSLRKIIIPVEMYNCLLQCIYVA
jgi:hypothetical protein